MNPLVLFAGTLLPEILKLVAGKNGDEIASTVQDVVTKVTGATTPEEAKAKIAADPKVDTELQLKLAQVALDAHKLDVEAQAKADADADRLAMESTGGARSALMQMLATPETLWIATTPTVISYMVVGGFLSLIGALLIFGHSDADFTKNQTILQILNICIGAIAAGFATVLNFWLGSSLGSRRKDQAAATIDKVREITQTTPGGGDQDKTRWRRRQDPVEERGKGRHKAGGRRQAFKGPTPSSRKRPTSRSPWSGSATPPIRRR